MNGANETIEALTQRLEQLEHGLRWWRRTVEALGVAVVVLAGVVVVLFTSRAPIATSLTSYAAASKSSPPSNTVTAQRFVLVDQQGNTLAILGLPHIDIDALRRSPKFKALLATDPTAADATLGEAEWKNSRRGPALTLYDRDGKRRATFDVDDLGSPELSLFREGDDSSGSSKASLGDERVARFYVPPMANWAELELNEKSVLTGKLNSTKLVAGALSFEMQGADNDDNSVDLSILGSGPRLSFYSPKYESVVLSVDAGKPSLRLSRARTGRIAQPARRFS